MKPRSSNKTSLGLTLVEVLVVVAVLVVFVAMLFPANDNSRRKAMRINCVNNLKRIGLAYTVWGGDSEDDYQIQKPVKFGGVRELLQNGIAYASYQVMSNELDTPKILICPADTNRFAATNFSTGFGNKNISYFVGVDASECCPQRLLSGDDNFEIGGVPVKSGLLELSTNMATYWLDVPVDWTDTRHKPRIGNIGFADGSVRETYFYSLRDALHQTGLATNRLAIP